MQIQFKSSHGELSQKLRDNVERKLTKLSELADTKESEAVATFVLERSVGAQNNGEVWGASLTIEANGEHFYASELSETPEKSAEKVLKEVRIELKKARAKRRAVTRREGGFWKGLPQRLSGE